MSSPRRAQIRLLSPADDVDAQLDLSERAFGRKSAADRDLWRKTVAEQIGHGRWLGAFAGSLPVAGAMFHDMRQWWCGRAVPMAGVGSVRVAPEERGRGVGRQLMAALLDEVAARGYPLSALYPATMPLYRSLGWELAGSRYTAVVPARSLRDLPPVSAVALRRAGPDDAEAVISVVGRVHQAARDCGPITWDAGSAGWWLADPDLYAYICDDGLLAYRWRHGNEDLHVERAEGICEQTLRAFWSQLGSHSSTAEKVYATVGPADAFWWLTRERDADVRRRSMWMLRVVDAAAAIAARGFPAAVSLTVPLHITDDARPANSGRWELTVAGGKGALVPAGSGGGVPLGHVGRVPLGHGGGVPLGHAGHVPLGHGGGVPLAVGARGLAALYAGTPVMTLRQAGLAQGGSPDDDAALDAAFAAAPYMLDVF
jgi:GNAT superfamily N-acetyltransferase